MPYIDALVHIWTPDTAHYPLAAGFKKSDMRPPSSRCGLRKVLDARRPAREDAGGAAMPREG
jgi:hypothetical protein